LFSNIIDTDNFININFIIILELNILSQSKQKFEKQWEDSLLAMVRRDSTLEEVHNNYVAAK